MKANTFCLAAAAIAVLSGCANKPEPVVTEEPIVVPAVHQERCYRMDSAAQERAGYALLKEGQQFYYQLDCDNYLLIGADAKEYERKALIKDGGVEAVKAANATNATNATKSVASAGAAAYAAPEEKVEKEPTCYNDKMTAGRGDLPPCPLEEDEID